MSTRSKKNLAWEKALRAEAQRWQMIAGLCGSGIGLGLVWIALLLLYFSFGV
jgi:hypothetical protein